nr:MAG TPA: hypothetical protein [Caudoviricetes sp.]DAP04175.1 MAG TPA: hypothetical protein [Caudoviricetes sp.]
MEVSRYSCRDKECEAVSFQLAGWAYLALSVIYPIF